MLGASSAGGLSDNFWSYLSSALVGTVAQEEKVPPGVGAVARAFPVG